MKKSDAKPALHALFGKWADFKGLPAHPIDQPSFSEFVSWARANGYGQYFEFRSGRDPRDDIEDWFDRHFKQSWRN
jgi:hypothetical protein